jgi:hypothetical protein
MSENSARELQLGPKEIVFTIHPEADFREITNSLEKLLTIPEFPGFKGCQPCLSGLDRIVIANPAFNRIR